MADPKYVTDFVREITPYAVAVGDQYGIDPVTIITQAAVETGWGREVAGNNYFGVKSHGRPGGQNITTHEEVNGKRVSTKDNFRTYDSLAESVADYGRFLSENPRYTEALKETGPGELQGIASAGYATDSKYPGLVRNVASMVQRNIQPLPPGSLPEVATLTDTVPPRTAAPVTPSPDMAQMRRTAPPSRLVADSFAALPPARQGLNSGDNLALKPVFANNFPQAGAWDGGYSPSKGAVTLNSNPRDIALPRPRPQTAPPDLISQSMAAIADANPQRTAPVPVAQSVDLRQSRLPLPNSTPIAPPPLPPRVTVSTANTTPQSQIDRGAPRPVAQAPSTRTVASVPVPASQRLPPMSAPPRQAIPQSFAGMEGGYSPPVAQPAGSTVAAKGQERLAATPALPPALYGGVAASAVPPMPYPTIARAPVIAPQYDPPAVATQLAVTPPRVAPIPFPRPNFGMGGVDIPAPLTRNGVAAPTPLPRLERGGIFGKPQIMGHDVPLPGILGMMQGATKAMNNASGPFNNGGDNLLYNVMRGGDFNTPGAATVQGRDGYLYAPKPGGGFINVGRSNRNLSPAQTSAAANQGLFRNGGNGTGSGGSSGGLNTVFDRAFGEARNYN